MRLRIYRDNLAIRIPGGFLGLAMCGFGLFALQQSTVAPDADLAARAVGFGLTMVFAGLSATLTSWLAPELSGIWCNSPRFFGRKRRRH